MNWNAPKNPAVSVIIPTYNRGWCLGRTIESVLNQSFKEFELIVIDDGSTDDTAELVQRYEGIRYFKLKDRVGVSAARNHGLLHAQSPWLSFLDSDDLWLPDKLEKQCRWFQSHPESRVCYTDEIWIRRGVRVNPRNKHRKYCGDVFRQCLPLCIISPSSVMMHEEVLGDIGTFDEDLPACEDYDLWLRLAARYPVDFIEDKLIQKTGGHDDQLSKKYWGMDRFRVYALEKLLRNEVLTEPRRRWVLQMLAEKCRILSAGFLNRGKAESAETYRRASETYSLALEHQPCRWNEEFTFEKSLLLPAAVD